MIIKDKILKFVLFLLISVSAFAEEVDDFSSVPKVPRDAAPVIDLATNALLDELILLLNNSNLSGCEDKGRYQLALKKLDQNFTAIGNGLRAGKVIKELLDLIVFDKAHQQLHQKRLLEVEDIWLAEFTPEKRDWFANLFSSVEYFGPQENKGSIYEKLDFLTCCTSRINVNGVYVGLDKIDHFFGNAGLLFEQFLPMNPQTSLNQRLAALMQINVRQEHSLWGLKGLSPKSYGDLAANWQGFHFYRELFDGSTPYIQCIDSVFKRNPVRTFHIKDYLDESWNESTNCSSFASDQDLNLFRENLKLAGIPCPRDPGICKDLVQKHKEDPLFVQFGLSPLCSGSPAAFVPIETAIPITWDEVELSFRGFTWPIIKELAKNKWAEMLADFLPGYLKNPNLAEGDYVFNQLKACRQFKGADRLNCLQMYTEPGINFEQLHKFSSILDEGIDFSQLMKCSAQGEELEKRLHPVPLGDLSLCFQTHYRNSESIGRIYFRRYQDKLRVVLLRM